MLDSTSVGERRRFIFLALGHVPSYQECGGAKLEMEGKWYNLNCQYLEIIITPSILTHALKSPQGGMKGTIVTSWPKYDCILTLVTHSLCSVVFCAFVLIHRACISVVRWVRGQRALFVGAHSSPSSLCYATLSDMCRMCFAGAGGIKHAASSHLPKQTFSSIPRVIAVWMMPASIRSLSLLAAFLPYWIGMEYEK